MIQMILKIKEKGRITKQTKPQTAIYRV